MNNNNKRKIPYSSAKTTPFLKRGFGNLKKPLFQGNTPEGREKQRKNLAKFLAKEEQLAKQEALRNAWMLTPSAFSFRY